MSKIHEAVADLRNTPGVKGVAVLTLDGLVAAAELDDPTGLEALAGIASWLLMTTARTLDESGMGGCSRLQVHATHGKAVLVDLSDSYLVVMLDQFTDIEQARKEIDEAALRVRRASRMA